MRTRTSLVCALLLLAASFRARAQSPEADTATARRLAREALAALDSRDYPKAAELFARAEKLHHAPTLLVGLARAQSKLGQFLEAQENYKRVLSEKLPDGASDAFQKALADARAEEAEVEKKIAWVTIRLVGPAEAQVLIDGVPVPPAAIGIRRAVNPGKHEVMARATGFDEAHKSFSVDAGGEQSVDLALAGGQATSGPPVKTSGPGESGAPASRPTGPGDASGVAGGADAGDDGAAVRTVGFVAIGLGGAGLLLGGISGILALNSHSALVDACPQDRCPQSEADTLDQYRVEHPLSTAGFVAGGVLAAAGIVMVLAAPSSDSAAPAPVPAPSSAALTLRLGPTTAELALRF